MSKIYPKFKEYCLSTILGAGATVPAGDVRAILVDSADYVQNDVHQFLSDVPAIARTAVSPSLTGKTFTNGVFDAADATTTAVTGDPSEAVIIYLHTGTDATARLVAYLDGLTFTPNGGDLNWQWNASGIFAL
jgi:hypothetical protein